MYKRSFAKQKISLNHEFPKNICILSISMIFLGCASEVSRIPAPIINNEITKEETKTNKKKLSKASEFALSPIWSKKGKLLKKKFSEIDGWLEDDFSNVWNAWKQNCSVMKKRSTVFKRICLESEIIELKTILEKKQFFEKHFHPFKILAPSNTITGYYEPVLNGSLTPSNKYSYPLYKRPDDLVIKRIRDKKTGNLKVFHSQVIKSKNGERLIPYPSRKLLSKSKHLKGYEIVYLENSIDAFFLQIQGSGTILLPDKSVMRLGFSASNGHPYRSIGSWLIKKKYLSKSSASMQNIKKWVKENPSREDELLNQNPRMIFFRDVSKSVELKSGPIGSLGVSLTPGRSIAVDKDFIALGLPLFLSTQLPGNDKTSIKNGKRLVFAQDTGSAIKGPNRGDFFFGSGKKAGDQAGKMKYPGQMIVLVPKEKGH